MRYPDSRHERKPIKETGKKGGRQDQSDEGKGNSQTAKLMADKFESERISGGKQPWGHAEKLVISKERPHFAVKFLLRGWMASYPTLGLAAQKSLALRAEQLPSE